MAGLFAVIEQVLRAFLTDFDVDRQQESSKTDKVVVKHRERESERDTRRSSDCSRIKCTFH